jgi:hypothetical protein
MIRVFSPPLPRPLPFNTHAHVPSPPSLPAEVDLANATLAPQ